MAAFLLSVTLTVPVLAAEKPAPKPVATEAAKTPAPSVDIGKAIAAAKAAKKYRELLKNPQSLQAIKRVAQSLSKEK